MHPRKNIILPFLVFSPLVVCSQPHQHSPELSRLSRALQFQTVSTYDSAAFNPVPYKGFIDWLQESYPRVHRQLEWSVINEYSLVYHWKGSDPSLSPGLFLAHYDVVPVEDPTKWARPAFSGHVDEHFIWGRGAVDNKSQVLALLESAEKLLQDGFIPRQTICFAFGHDEEIGGDQGASHIFRHFQSKGLRFDFVMDEGGVMAQNVFPGVEERIAFIGTAEKGDLNILLSVEDKGGHSSAPPPETAISILSGAIKRVTIKPMKARLQAPTLDMLKRLAPYADGMTRFAIRNRGLFGKKILKTLSKNYGTNALIRTVMSATMVHGGMKENALPNLAWANLNVRLIQGDDVASVMKHLEEVIDDPRVRLTVKGGYHLASAISDTMSNAWTYLRKTINTLYPDAIISPVLAPGTTDSRHYASLTNNIFRFLPVTITNDNKEMVHGNNEKIGVKEYLDMIRFYTELIREVGKM